MLFDIWGVTAQRKFKEEQERNRSKEEKARLAADLLKAGVISPQSPEEKMKWLSRGYKRTSLPEYGEVMVPPSFNQGAADFTGAKLGVDLAKEGIISPQSQEEQMKYLSRGYKQATIPQYGTIMYPPNYGSKGKEQPNYDAAFEAYKKFQTSQSGSSQGAVSPRTKLKEISISPSGPTFKIEPVPTSAELLSEQDQVAQLDARKKLNESLTQANQLMGSAAALKDASINLGDFERGVFGQVKAKLDLAGKAFSADKNFTRYKTIIQQRIIPVARALGNTGVLTDVDVDRTIEGLGSPSLPLADKLFALNTLVDSMESGLLRQAEQAGMTPEQTKARYASIFKQFEDIRSELGGQQSSTNYGKEFGF